MIGEETNDEIEDPGKLWCCITARGELAKDDQVSDSKGQYYDEWTVRAEAGRHVSVILEGAFDTQLQVRLPDGAMLVNDDNNWGAETTDSRFNLVMPGSGQFAIRPSIG